MMYPPEPLYVASLCEMCANLRAVGSRREDKDEKEVKRGVLLRVDENDSSPA